MPLGGTAPGRQTAKARLTAARDRSADGADAETAPTVPGGTAATHRPKRHPARVPLPRKTVAMRVRIAAIHPSRVIRPRRAVSNPVPADPIGEDAGTAIRESVRTAAEIPRSSEAGTLLRPATVRQSAGRLHAGTAIRESVRTAAEIPRSLKAGTLLRPATVRQSAGRLHAGTAVRESVRTAAGILRSSEAGTLLRPVTVRQSAGRLRAETAVRGYARTAAAIPSRSPECRAVRREPRTGPPSELRHRAPAGICRISDRAGAAAPVRMRET